MQRSISGSIRLQRVETLSAGWNSQGLSSSAFSRCFWTSRTNRSYFRLFYSVRRSFKSLILSEISCAKARLDLVQLQDIYCERGYPLQDAQNRQKALSFYSDSHWKGCCFYFLFLISIFFSHIMRVCCCCLFFHQDTNKVKYKDLPLRKRMEIPKCEWLLDALTVNSQLIIKQNDATGQ